MVVPWELDFPAGHAKQAVPKSVDFTPKRPAAQGATAVQTLDEQLILCHPSGISIDVVPPAAIMPNGGDWQLVCPGVSCSHPCGQDLQDAVPVVAAYLPGAHSKHSEEPVLLAYFPTSHATHDACDVCKSTAL